MRFLLALAWLCQRDVQLNTNMVVVNQPMPAREGGEETQEEKRRQANQVRVKNEGRG